MLPDRSCLLACTNAPETLFDFRFYANADVRGSSNRDRSENIFPYTLKINKTEISLIVYCELEQQQKRSEISQKKKNVQERRDSRRQLSDEFPQEKFIFASTVIRRKLLRNIL